jgi:hypothetical protein
VAGPSLAAGAVRKSPPIGSEEKIHRWEFTGLPGKGKLEMETKKRA